LKAATVIYHEHALVPSKRRTEQATGQTIASLDPKWDRPYIALLDGKPILRRDWNLYVENGRILVFIDAEAIPAGGGGGGSNPVRMIAMLAVIAISAGVAGAVAGMGAFAVNSAGVAGTVLGMGGATWGAIAGGAVMLVGSAIVNAVLPATPQSMSNRQLDTKAASPTYSLQAQGNSARLEQAIPEHFGRHIAYPDFAANPYQEYSGNEQYLYQLLCLGRGYYDIETIRIEDTPISNFEDIEYEIVQPNQTVTMFPASVTTSPEVSGQDMVYNTYLGPFVANAADTLANYIGIDFVAPRGLYYAEDNGSLSAKSIGVAVEAREIDEDGVAIGSYVTLGSRTYTASSATPQRYSLKFAVAPGRYEVRVKRTSTKDTSTRAGHDIVWGSLRAYLKDDATYGDVTLIAMRMRASDQLSSISSRKINVIATRRLPIWNGSTWSSPAATRSIAWALAYCCKQIGLTDAQIDLATLLQLDATWAARGDTCDGRIDSTMSFWETLTRIGAAGRCKPYMQSGVVRFFRDQASTLPVAHFGVRNIVKNSLSIDYIMPSQDTADAVSVSYFDGSAWRQKRVLAKLPDSTAAKPAKMDLALVTNRAQAFKEGTYQAASNRYRRKVIKFTTEMEGFIPSFGDLIAIHHDMPGWGQGGDVVGWDAGTSTLTLSEPLTWEEGETHYIAFAAKNGSMVGPFVVTAGLSEYQCVVTESMIDANDDPWEPYAGSDYERTRFSFGWAETWSQKARVLSVMPRSMERVEIQAINEDNNVHTAEEGLIVPVAPTSQLANYTAAPSLSGLLAVSRPDDVATMLLSWQPSPWADHYLIEASSDGTSWTRLGDTSATNFTARAIYGNATILRVAAVGTARGPWVTVSYGDSADYMWAADDATLMWNADDTTLMWRY
jgi:hypothetical protein